MQRSILLSVLALDLVYVGSAYPAERKSNVVATQPLEKDLDIGRFARSAWGSLTGVVTWDPNRTASHPSRIEELKPDEIFLETDVLPAADGTYVVPLALNGQSCIGLQWMQRIESSILKELVLEFAEGSPTPSASEIRVEWWVGESAWQGDWKPLPVKIEQQGNRRFFRVVWGESGPSCIGVEKIRWIFSSSTRPFIVRKIEAFTLCQWDTVVLNLELEQPKTAQVGKIDVYNGEMMGPPAKDSSLHCEWDLAGPLQLKIRYCKPETPASAGASLSPRKRGSDRTLITVQLPAGTFSVSVNDVLEHGCVYVPAFGFFMAKDSAGVSLDKYRQEVSARRTIRQRVRQMEDQSFTQAMEKVHHKVQDNGPTMLSLACDNHKFVVERKGDIWVWDGLPGWHGLPAHEIDSSRPGWACHKYTAKMAVPQGGFNPPDVWRIKLIPKFGSGSLLSRKAKDLGTNGDSSLRSDGPLKWTRNMYGGWLPVPVTTLEEDGLRYRQRTFVAPYGKENPQYHPWLQRQPICVAELTVENPLPDSIDASLRLRFLADAGKNQPAELLPVQRGTIVQKEGRLLAFVDTTEIPSLSIQTQNGDLVIGGPIPGQTTERCFVYIPTWQIKPDEYASLKGGTNLLSDTEAYWNNILASGTQIEIPEPLLLNVIRAWDPARREPSQVYCLMAARNEEHGKRIAAWIASDRYGPLESEAHSVIRGMDLMGHEDFARRSLEFFINKYNPAGYLTTGYTVMGTGWHLWTLAEHYQLTEDSQWFKRVAPEVARVCQWIVRQREKTKRINALGERVPEYGLMPPGVAADWNRFGYRSYNQGNFYAGLYGAACCLADIGHPDANSLLSNAAQFRGDIQRAYQWTQQRSPIVPLVNGTWVPYYPSFVYGFGEDAFPGEDGGRSWCYDVEIGSHHLAVLGVLDESDQNIDWIADRMEDFWFFQDGLYDYPAQETSKDWFNLGGFSKVQPYYARIQELYALIDDVKPFIRS